MLSTEDTTNVDFIVHNFTDLDKPSPSDHTSILDAGRIIVEASRSSLSTQWKTVTPGCKFKPNVVTKGNVYVLALTAPRVPNNRKRWREQIKNWGSQAESDEIYNLRDLEEFRNDITPMVSTSKSSPHRPHRRLWGERAHKRQRLEAVSLYSCIPQPHMLPSLYHPKDPTLDPDIQPYVKAKAAAIPPNSSTDFTPSPLSRTAWLIPVRGSLPWEGSTSATILSSSQGSSPAPVNMQISDGEPNQIVWTQQSLIDFWEFLKSAREAGQLGSIGLSFHASPHPSQGGRKSLSIYQGNQASDTTASGKNDVTPGGIERSSYSEQRSINDVDYIKIYHDAMIAMRLRSVLDAWKYIIHNLEGENRKVRVLVGAKLVLLDERSRGLLIC